MAGKKKKSLANKLAKMSDEERARYLQHRAEIEEEAKRRKEQLIATFMKKKIKKEEAFSRLNVAKINQNWHQIMRKIKVKEMKDEIEHLKKRIEDVVEYKNRTISKLMDELEEAEEQYLNNFNSHSIHVDNIIENQNEYIEKLQLQYRKKLDELLDQARGEENSIENNSNSEITYLKTVIYGQGTQADKKYRENWEYYSKKLYEVDYNNRVKIRHLRETRGKTESALWNQILQIVRLYVQKTDVRRSHLQELRRMDAESADEIRRNEERIIKEEELIKILNCNYEDLLKLKGDKIKSLETEETSLKTQFLKIRKVLKSNLVLDEKQLRFLTAVSNDTLNEFEQLISKGKYLLALSDTCQKFETEREKVTKWLPVMVIGERSESSASEKDEASSEELVQGDRITDDEKLLKQTLEKEVKSYISEAGPSTSKQKPRPKTALTSRFPKSDIAEATDTLPTPESQVAPIEEVKFATKKSEGTELKHEDNLDIKKNFLDKCYESLEKMENFWTVYNKAKIDVMELKREKDVLEKENKRMRGLIRAVLEAAALAKTLPDSRVPTRVQSKSRSAVSAPLRRIIFN